MSSAAPTLCRQTARIAARATPTRCTCSPWRRGRATRKRRNALFRESLSRAPRAAGRARQFRQLPAHVQSNERSASRCCAQQSRWRPSSFRVGTTSAFCCASSDGWTKRTDCADKTNALVAARMRRAGNCAPQSNSSAATSPLRSRRAEPDLRHAPAAARLHYSLGQLLREDCRFAEAARAYEAAHAYGFDTPDLYRTAARRISKPATANRLSPCSMPASLAIRDDALLHRLRARPALGNRRAQAIRWRTSGKPPATHPRDATLWHTLAGLLKRLDRTDEVGRGIGRSEAFGLSAHAGPRGAGSASAARVPATSRKQLDCSTRSLRSIRHHTGYRLAFVEHLLSTGDPARAEQVCAAIISRRSQRTARVGIPRHGVAIARRRAQ